MNSDYIKEELGLLLKDKLITDYEIIESLSNEDGFETSEVKKIFITTLEQNILEISINDSFCYKVDKINSNLIKNEDNSNCLFEDLSNLIHKHSINFRNKFNDILKEKLSNLQNDDYDD